jgi:hypothetical protein
MNRPEQALQRGAIQYLRMLENLGELVAFHCPFGGSRSRTEAAIFKGLGVRAGVPDIVIVLPIGRVDFIELKAGAGQLSENQKQFKKQIEAMGAPYAECRDLNQVENFVRELIAAEPARFQDVG